MRTRWILAALLALCARGQVVGEGSPADDRGPEGPGQGGGGAAVCRGGGCKGAMAMVSVLTPTRAATQHRHALLYMCFAHQTHPNRELVVLDDSPSPSPFFSQLQDPFVTYLHSKESMSLGKKRNLLAEKASGSVLAHFDDDDWYAPEYLEALLREMRRKKAGMVKLSGWFVYSCKLHFFGYYDPGETAVFGEVSDDKYKYSLFLDPRDPIVQTWVMGPSEAYDSQLRDETRYGFGFSYMYKKSVWEKVRFNDSKTFGEDLEWVTQVRKGRTKVHHFADRQGLSLHIQGSWNTARIPVQYKIPAFLVGKVLDVSAQNFTEC